MNTNRILRALLPVAFMLLIALGTAVAQPNPASNAGGGAVGGDPIGGGAAPVGSGVVWLIGLAAGYAAQRVALHRKASKNTGN